MLNAVRLPDLVDHERYTVARLVFQREGQEILRVDVRYKGSGLHITFTRIAMPLVLEGGDWGDIDRLISRVYTELVERTAELARERREQSP